MTTEERLASLDAKMDALLRLQQEAMTSQRRPNLRIVDFAKLAGKSRWTIQRDIRDGKLRKVNGRIPRDQLSKYTA